MLTLVVDNHFVTPLAKTNPDISVSNLDETTVLTLWTAAATDWVDEQGWERHGLITTIETRWVDTVVMSLEADGLIVKRNDRNASIPRSVIIATGGAH